MDKCLKNSSVCFKANTRPSLFSKRIFENLFRRKVPYIHWNITWLFVIYILPNTVESFLWDTSTTQEMKFSIKGFFSDCDQIRKKLQIWSHLLKKSWMGNFIFVQCRAVSSQLVTLVTYVKYLNSDLITNIFKKNKNWERERKIRLNEVFQSRK